MNDLERDLGALFREKAGSIDTAPLAPTNVLRRAGRRQRGIVLTGTVGTVVVSMLLGVAIGQLRGPSVSQLASAITPTTTTPTTAATPSPSAPSSFPSAAVEVSSFREQGRTITLFAWVNEGGFCVGVQPSGNAFCDHPTPAPNDEPMVGAFRIDPANSAVVVFGITGPDVRTVKVAWPDGSGNQASTTAGPSPFDRFRFFLWSTEAPAPVAEATFEFFDASGRQLFA
jgi:hypothetical protein